MRKVKKEDSLLEWAQDSVEIALKIASVIVLLLSIPLFVKGLVMIYKSDYMGFLEILFMSDVEYDLEIMKNNPLFTESYNGYSLIIMAMRITLLSFAMFVMSRFWGATTRIKHIYRHCFGKDFKLEA